jgi:hypothetical protein
VDAVLFVGVPGEVEPEGLGIAGDLGIAIHDRREHAVEQAFSEEGVAAGGAWRLTLPADGHRLGVVRLDLLHAGGLPEADLEQVPALDDLDGGHRLQHRQGTSWGIGRRRGALLGDEEPGQRGRRIVFPVGPPDGAEVVVQPAVVIGSPLRADAPPGLHHAPVLAEGVLGLEEAQLQVRQIPGARVGGVVADGEVPVVIREAPAQEVVRSARVPVPQLDLEVVQGDGALGTVQLEDQTPRGDGGQGGGIPGGAAGGEGADPRGPFAADGGALVGAQVRVLPGQLGGLEEARVGVSGPESQGGQQAAEPGGESHSLARVLDLGETLDVSMASADRGRASVMGFAVLSLHSVRNS